MIDRMDKNAKIYVAGHHGLVGSAIWKNLQEKGYTNLVGRTHKELDLLDGAAVKQFFDEEMPEYVFLAAAFVGGIMANSIYRADFIYKNLQIQQNVIGESFRHQVKKLLFLGSTRIYQVYLKYIAPEDIVVYSIDEVFLDVTDYLNTYQLSAHDLAMKIILDVLETTGITATAGIGTNLFLCKVAMDIVAKHIPADKNGVRIAELDEMKFRRELWSHQPLTDFWRVGRGIAKKLEQNGMFTMGDVALCSERNEDLLYKLFGKNAELLIDHAWGWEPTTIEAIKAYRPSSNSISSGQVLHCPYEPQKAKLVVREMTDLLVLDLVDKGLVTDQMVLTVGYDIENLTDPARRAKYHGAVETDHYGRQIPKQAHGSINLDGHTSSTRKIMCAVSELFDRIVDKNLLVRRMYVVANHVLPEADAPKKSDGAVQLDLFTDYAAEEEKQKAQDAALERERKIQKAALAIKKKYGKNAILKAMNLEEGATAKDRNAQIGGHKA